MLPAGAEESAVGTQLTGWLLRVEVATQAAVAAPHHIPSLQGHLVTRTITVSWEFNIVM